MSLQRYTSQKIPVTIGTSTANAERVPMGSYAGGFFVAAGSLSTLLFYGTTEPGGTLVPIHDSSNAAVSRDVTADKGYALPDECFACAEIALVHASGGTVAMCLKS